MARTESLPAEDEVLAQFEEQRRLADLINRLDKPYRLVLLRHFYRGESAAEIARSTGQPSATVRSQLARALVRLRELHTQEHRGDEHRSLKALGLAAGSSGLLPVTPLTTTALASLFAMNTTTKLVTASVVAVVLLAGGREAYRAMKATSDDRTANASRPVDLVAATVDPVLSPPPKDEPETPDHRAVVQTSQAQEPAPPVNQPTSLSLRVVDQRSLPIAGARLVFVELDGAPRELSPSEATGADGRILVEVERTATFRYAGQVERLVPFRLDAPGHASKFQVETTVEGAIVELGDCHLEAGASLAGHVIDAQGVGAPGVEIVAMYEELQGSTRRFYSGGEGPRSHETKPPNDERGNAASSRCRGSS